MNSNRSRLVAATLILLSVALWTGCNKSEPNAEADWVIKVTANPADLTLGSNNEGTSDIIAVVYDKTGNTQSGVGVRFSTSQGRMESGGQIVKTDGRGEARDVLHASADATVTVVSGSVAAQVSVTVGGQNAPPTAGITITPPDRVKKGNHVLFSGATSSDTDGEITNYDWEFWYNPPQANLSNPEKISTSNQAYDHPPYANAGTVDVTLVVTDNLGSKSAPTTHLGYPIVGNLPPKANGGPSSVTGLVVANPYQCTVSTDCSASSDPDGRITMCEWFWGDGRIDRVSQITGSPIGRHTYTAPGTYTVTLRTYDDGEDNLCPSAPPPTGSDTCATRLFTGPQGSTSPTFPSQPLNPDAIITVTCATS